MKARHHRGSSANRRFWKGCQRVTSLAACTVAILALLGASREAHAAVTRPNFVFILADDLGWRDLSIEGSTFYESPNIDRIARSGMRFTQGYAACQVCSPSRASILTGKFTARHGITEWIGAAQGTQWKRNTRLLPAHYRHNLEHADVTLAEALREAGYRTFFAGKWHLGGEGSYPEDHGFEFNVGGHERGSPPGGFFSPYHNPKMEDGPVGESLPVRLGLETAKFITAHKEEPFLAYLAFYSVHAPIQTTEGLWKKYRDKASQQPAPDHRFLIDRTSPVRQVQDNPIYGGMVEAMDEAVGMVLAAIEQAGLADNTIVIFTSDNGGVSAGDAKATSNLPLRGGKGRQWEGGIREPFYIKWPGVVPAGSACATPVTGADFYPTLLEMAGLPLRPKQHVDGLSLVPLLKGGSLPARPLFWHYPHYSNQGGDPSSIIREGDWKLIAYHEDGHDELYNLASDQEEQHDVAAEHPDLVRSMHAKLMAFLEETGAQFPDANPNFSEERFAREREQTRNVTLPNLELEHAGYLKPDFVPSGGWWQFRGN